jgi:hypothetical protein
VTLHFCEIKVLAVFFSQRFSFAKMRLANLQFLQKFYSGRYVHMKFSEVKALFLTEFGRMGMSARDLRNTWFTFAEDLFSSGEINQRVYMRCMEV